MLLTHLTTFIMALQDERVRCRTEPGIRMYQYLCLSNVLRTGINNPLTASCVLCVRDHLCTCSLHVFADYSLVGSLQLNPEVKLLRVLLRTDCDGVRKSMLQERLQLPNQDIFLVRQATR